MKQFFDQPISFRKRDHRVAKLVRKGKTTDDELFEAQFGEWPVRGLEKDTPRTKEVTFKNFYWNITSLAYVRDDTPEREIHLNRILLSPLGQFGMGGFSTRQAFARVHDLIDLLEPELLGTRFGLMFLAAGFFSSYRYAAASSLVKLVAPSIANEVGQEHIHVMQLKDGDRSFARNAFQAAANDLVQTSSPLKRLGTEISQIIDILLTWMPRDYFGRDHELQARMHNLMARGYPAWGKIPSTKSELWSALYDMGIRSPTEKVLDTWLQHEGNEGLRKTYLKHSRFLSAYTHPPSAEMNIGLNSSRNAAVQQSYWLDCLPAAYGDLLVKYGDSQGRRKMGFSDEDDYDILGLPAPMRSDDEPPPAAAPGKPTP